MSILTAPQLTAAAINLVAEFDPTRLPRTDLTQALTGFLVPLTHDGLKRADVDALIEAANSHFEAHTLAFNDPLEGKPYAWERHANEALTKVREIAENIVKGENIA